jgi:hypothetical protein
MSDQEDFLRDAAVNLYKKSPGGQIIEAMAKGGELLEDGYAAGKRMVKRLRGKPAAGKRTTDIALPNEPKRRKAGRSARR